MHRLAYAAPFEVSPGRVGWVLVRHDSGMRRVDEVSDWLTVTATVAAPNTAKSRAEALALWWRWCLETGVDPLTTDAVRFARFVTALQTIPKGLSLSSPVRALPGDPRLRRPATVALRVVHIKAFYRWAMHNGRVGVLAGRAVTGFPTPRAPRVMTAARLQPDQVTALAAAELTPRDRWVVELLYGAGLREGEALGLRVEDWCVNPAVASVFGCPVPGGPHLHVRRRLNSNGAWAKSPLERVVPISARVMTAYRDWQAWAFDHVPQSVECPYLLISLSGPTRAHGWSIPGFASMWHKKIQTIPGLEPVTPHLLRHTFASELADAGASAFTIQTLLGHQSPASTQIYTHALMDTLVAVVGNLDGWRAHRFGIAG